MPITTQIESVRSALAACGESSANAAGLSAALATLEWIAANREAVVVAAQEVRRAKGNEAVRVIQAGLAGACIIDIRKRKGKSC